MRHLKSSLLGYLAIPAFSTLLVASCTSAGPSAADGDHDEAVGEAHDALTPEQCNYYDVNGTVQICHKTGSATKPYTIIRVSDQACINGHSGHAHDYVTSLDPSSSLYDPTCGGQGCLAVNAPCDPTVPCCDGLSCQSGTCTDVDECALGTDNCDANATCTNTSGSFTCACGEGYSGDGVTCTDVDECALGTDNCDANATCTNTSGSFTCACDEGYEGDGVTCTAIDVDECALGTDNCDANATCTNTTGSFTCACNEGYVGDGLTCVEPGCGNGVLEAPAEVCDDGNQTAGDGCRANCAGLEVCGDGLTDYLTEECDDGDDTNPADGCHACQLPTITSVPAQKINGTLSCPSGGSPNTGRKISSDALGNFHVVMLCAGEAFTASSQDFGQTWSTPISTGLTEVAEAAIEGGVGNTAYVAATRNPGKLSFTRSTDGGASWEAVQDLVQPIADAEVSIDSLGQDVYIAVVPTGGQLQIVRNDQGGDSGAWASTALAQLNAFHEIIVDKISGTVISASDTPQFRVRTSTDGGVTFAPEANPPGGAFFSDWAGSNGLLYTTGTAGGTDIDIIPLSAPGTSTQVNGLPANGFGPLRAIDADPLGNAYVVSQLNDGSIQLDRMVYQSGAISAADARLIAASGSAPGVAGLPNSQGAIVVFRSGSDIYAAVEAY
ncbi:EGF domain-containing protein [Sorangium sp. So ce429]